MPKKHKANYIIDNGEARTVLTSDGYRTLIVADTLESATHKAKKLNKRYRWLGIYARVREVEDTYQIVDVNVQPVKKKKKKQNR
jgi:hypothetical protein